MGLSGSGIRSLGTALSALTGHESRINAVCALTVDGTTHLATGGDDATVRIWDPATGTTLSTLTGYQGRVSAMCAPTIGSGITYLATGGDDGSVRLWDPPTSTTLSTLTGHQGRISAMCALTIGSGITYLATGGSDATVRIWDPATEASALAVPTRDPVSSVGYANDLLFVGTSGGVLAIRLDPGFLGRQYGHTTPSPRAEAR